MRTLFAAVMAATTLTGCIARPVAPAVVQIARKRPAPASVELRGPLSVPLPAIASLRTEIPIPDRPEVNRFVSYYGLRNRESVRKAMERREPHRAMIEQVFLRYGLPTELADLAILESGFQTHVSSPRGAVGPWQFIASTARRYGLKVGKGVDERKDIAKSTEAAAKLLAELYREFGDWPLALAAFNSGSATVSRAIARTGSRDFFEMSRKGHLPRETAEFVPRFLALALVCREILPIDEAPGRLVRYSSRRR